MDIAQHRRVASGILLALVVACAWAGVSQVRAAEVPASTSTTDPRYVDPSTFVLRTTQLVDPLRPFKHLPTATRVRVRAVVETVPDPTETHLGRTFDMVVSATLAAYQSQKYVLDGYAFPWKPVDPDAKGPATTTDKQLYRDIPGVLLFRRDWWRETGKASYPEYAVVFLVGEAPSYGVHLEAFNKAAHCAAAYNYARVVNVAYLQVDRQCHELEPALLGSGDAKRPVGLDVIGPSFSGSMQSLAIAVAQLREPCNFSDLRVLLVSPSATVDSNGLVNELKLPGQELDCKGNKARYAIEYFPIARSLKDQVHALLEFLCSVPGSEGRRIAVLAEESTFGRGVESLFESKDFFDPARGCANQPHVRVYNFPPNISSIRAEHSTLRRASEPQVPGMPKTPGRLLELDMTTDRATLDRPITYEPSLTARSDELMLYRLFDSLSMYRKPNVVVILATDIRDRLFLLSEVRNALPAALPVMMELDYLAIHPDYRATSRGAIVVPSGDSIVCLRSDAIVPQDSEEAASSDESAGRKASKSPEVDDGAIVVPCRNWGQVRTFSFATDHAANAFRANVLLLQRRDRPRLKFDSFRSDADDQMKKASTTTPCLYLATLAGFNELTFPERAMYCARKGPERARSSMVAADMRMAGQMPAYLALALLATFFLVVAGWVSRRPREARVLLSATRYVLLDGTWLKEAFARLKNDAKALHFALITPGKLHRLFRTTARRGGPRTDPSRYLNPGRVRDAMWWLFALSATALVLSIWRWTDASDDQKLAHGRDWVAMLCVWLLYGCYCTLAFARMKLADHRINAYIDTFAPRPGMDRRNDRRRDRPPALSWAIPMFATVAVLLVMFLSLGDPTGVDPTWPWRIAMLVLAMGVAFLVNCGRLLRLIGKVTLYVSSAIPNIRQRPGMKEWPAPHVVHVSPQTPFNLTLLRHRDVRALQYAEPDTWGETTRHLAGAINNQSSVAPIAFDEWQQQLVAELKAYVVAMRACAWCAILAPITLLLALSIYSPVFERRITTLAVVLLLTSFAYIVYAVLRLEQDPILGPMFTRDGDKLTFGGGLRALWPKFVAIGVVLLPLVLPSVWGWLHDLIRSVNSFT